MTRSRDTGLRKWEYAPDTYGLVEDISDTLICREQDQFLATDADGDIPPGNRRGLGFYARDARHLSTYTLLVNGEKPLVLASAAESGFSQEQVLGNRRGTFAGQPVGRATIELVRNRLLEQRLTESLTVSNHNPFEIEIDITYHFDADFADIFEVRGHLRQHPGSPAVPNADANSICYRYLGADGVWRQTLVRFDQAPDSLTPQQASFRLLLGPRATRVLTFSVSTEGDGAALANAGMREMRADYDAWRAAFPDIHTDSEIFNEVLGRAIGDLRTLWTEDGQAGGFFAAGVPWYATLFGRDALITSLQVLGLRPDLAKQCLEVLARHQGQSFDPRTVQEPGKILHELREGELSVIGELPYQRYYGSVDSTPLFLVLAGEYFASTGDLQTIEALIPAIRQAFHWVQNGTKGEDPYLRYATDSETGLRNQGWKDSIEAIMHADGSLCEGPIALAEVQGYVYRACSLLAPLADRLGLGELAREMELHAGRLQAAFGRDFWLAEEGRVSMALDGASRPTTVVSSNAGQVLWGGLLDETMARAVRDSLFLNDMFSGWGIRTLSANTASYLPLGYHLGTVWPHDNAIIAAGLKRYGYDAEVEELLTALFDAAQQFPGRRLPELFGGQARAPYMPPVPYPVACRPQAWAAGALLQLLQTTLGLRADAAAGRLYIVRPRLPAWLDRVQIDGLRVGETSASLHFYRQDGRTVFSAQLNGELEIIQSTDSSLFGPA